MARTHATGLLVLAALSPFVAQAATRVTGVVTVAGQPRADVTVALAAVTTRTDAAGRYTLEVPGGVPDALPKATLAGWQLEARPRQVNGQPSFTDVDFVATGATLKGRLPETLKRAPTVSDGVRSVVASRGAPDEEWAYTLELVPTGEVALTATAPGATLRLHPA